MNDKERIAALTRAYIAHVNFGFNKMYDNLALFKMVMKYKDAADDAMDRDVRDEIFREMRELPPNVPKYCRECGTAYESDGER